MPEEMLRKIQLIRRMLVRLGLLKEMKYGGDIWHNMMNKVVE